MNVERKQQKLWRQDINKDGSTASVSNLELSKYYQKLIDFIYCFDILHNSEHSRPIMIVNVTPLNAYHKNEIEYKGRKKFLSSFNLKSNNVCLLDKIKNESVRIFHYTNCGIGRIRWHASVNGRR